MCLFTGVDGQQAKFSAVLSYPTVKHDDSKDTLEDSSHINHIFCITSIERD